MTENSAQAGSGISFVEPAAVAPHLSLVTAAPDPALSPEMQALLTAMRGEFNAAVADVEFRLAQTYELQARAEGRDSGRVFVEDIHDQKHRLTGFTLTSNSPVAGSIAWASLHIVYLGVDYTIADGSTALKYTWFVKPGSGTTATLTSSNTQPVLGPQDALVFVNNGGTAIDASASNIAAAVAPNSVTNAALVDGAVTAAKTDFYSTLATAVTTAQTAADLAQATADGSITTYFQSAAPWANGTTQAVAKVGDIWYDSDDGKAYRWSGAAGSPANTWVAITDTGITTALANAAAAQTSADSKVTTFFAAIAAVPTALRAGDLWYVTDQNNKLRRSTAAGTASWTDVLLGDSAISGISGSKVGSGINGANITASTVGNSQLATNAVTPAKINAAFHLLY